MSRCNHVAAALKKGYSISLHKGRVRVIRHDGSLSAPEKLKEYERAIMLEIAEELGMQVFQLVGWSSGNYEVKETGRREPGLTLNFVELVTRQEAFTIFNVIFRRERSGANGGVGEPLRKGKFRVGKRSHFVKFWVSTGLPIHKPSDFHRRIGKLKPFFFTADWSKGEKLANATLKPVCLSAEEVAAAFGVANSSLSGRQAVAKPSLKVVAKDSPQAQAQQGLQPESSTGHSNYGNKVIRKRGIREPSIPSLTTDITNDEWLSAYYGGDHELTRH